MTEQTTTEASSLDGAASVLDDGLCLSDKKREYRIKSTGMGQAHYGSCERCGKPCQMTYKQQSRKIGDPTGNWLSSGFGHIDCLRTGMFIDAPVDHDA